MLTPFQKRFRADPVVMQGTLGETCFGSGDKVGVHVTIDKLGEGNCIALCPRCKRLKLNLTLQ